MSSIRQIVPRSVASPVGFKSTAVFDRFVDLPAELRHKVIKQALFPTKASFAVKAEDVTLPPLMHVSRVIRSEAVRIYRENVTLTAYVVMEHSYMDVLLPEYRSAFKNLNKGAVLKNKFSHLDSRGPLPVPSFASLSLQISDIDQCRLFTVDIVVRPMLTGCVVEPYLTVLPSSVTRLGWLEIAAVEKLPVDWAPHMNEMLDASGGRGFSTRQIETLASMLQINYDKTKFTPESRLISFGGDDVKGHFWKKTTSDKTISPVEDFGTPRTLGARPSDAATDAQPAQQQDMDAEGSDEEVSEVDDEDSIDQDDDENNDDDEEEDEDEDEDEDFQGDLSMNTGVSPIQLPQIPEPKFPDLEGDISMNDLF